MNTIKAFLNKVRLLISIISNIDKFVDVLKVDSNGNVFIRFKRNLHINSNGHLLMTSRKGHIIVRGEHFHMQPDIPELFTNGTGYTDSKRMIEKLQSETRIKLDNLNRFNLSEVVYPTFVNKPAETIEKEIDIVSKQEKLQWKY